MEYRSFVRNLLIVFCLVVESMQNADGAAESRPSPRILNGRTAGIGQFPYQVSIRLNDQHICGGALLTQNYVITAAHCVHNIGAEYLGVRAGSVRRTEGGDYRGVVTVITHSQFMFDNDIALLEVGIPFNYSDVIKPITFATADVPAGESVVISGWGRTSEGASSLSTRLMYNKELKTLRDEDCVQTSGSIKPSILCLSATLGNGFCDGDDGGPAVYRNILVGIASYNANACGTPAKGGFTKVAYYKNWIKTVLSS